MRAIYSLLMLLLCIAVVVGVGYTLCYLGWYIFPLAAFAFCWAGVHATMYDEPSNPDDGYSLL